MHLNTAELAFISGRNWHGELAFILVFCAGHVQAISSERYLNFKPNELLDETFIRFDVVQVEPHR